MTIIGILVANIIPLYVLIALGYIAGRWLDVNLHSLARVAIFIIAPIVTFGAVAQLDFKASFVLLPVIALTISCFVTFIMYTLACRAWKNNTANLIGLGSVSGNTGYFGLPVVLALYGAEWAGVYLLMNMGTQIAESTFGYFLGARGHHSITDSVKKVLKLPALHAIYLGLIVNFSGLDLPDIVSRYWTYATGAWVFIGMMLIGVALSKMPRLEISFRLIRWLFIAKFILWPALGISVILLDQAIFHLFPVTVYGLILVFTSVPLMSNLVAFAAQLDLHPEKAATAVLSGTVFAIVYMPVLFWLAQHYGLIP